MCNSTFIITPRLHPSSLKSSHMLFYGLCFIYFITVLVHTVMIIVMVIAIYWKQPNSIWCLELWLHMTLRLLWLSYFQTWETGSEFKNVDVIMNQTNKWGELSTHFWEVNSLITFNIYNSHYLFSLKFLLLIYLIFIGK